MREKKRELTMHLLRRTPSRRKMAFFYKLEHKKESAACNIGALSKISIYTHCFNVDPAPACKLARPRLYSLGCGGIVIDCALASNRSVIVAPNAVILRWPLQELHQFGLRVPGRKCRQCKRRAPRVYCAAPCVTCPRE